MVKRYFRPFICAVCTAMSVICGCSPMFSVYVSAAEVTDGAETAVNEESEADAEETEPQTQAESESETETESEKQTESELGQTLTWRVEKLLLQVILVKQKLLSLLKWIFPVIRM